MRRTRELREGPQVAGVGRRVASALCAVGVIATTVAVIQPLPQAVAATASAKGNGGTVTFAELPNTPPDYIFPLEPLEYYAFNNIEFLQYILCAHYTCTALGPARY